ncbi:MAG TPA: Clp protease N-terminal domain-containing protein [Lacisediminihabitans sp.]|uniref:Clp protease N-terminal domain-containing protein n=1 Tax=Lacisediminihabitans sp. TaxID=2787631 RepID=UPI002EDA381E
MDEESLPQGLRAFVLTAIDEAARRGAGTVQAEHVLLAVAADKIGAASKVLVDAGLDYEAIVAALREERARSLATAGITPVDASLLESTPRRSARPTWGASVRDAMDRGRRSSARNRRRRSPDIDLLIGILGADVGTVPRALAIAGIDRHALIDRLQQL